MPLAQLLKTIFEFEKNIYAYDKKIFPAAYKQYEADFAFCITDNARGTNAENIYAYDKNNFPNGNAL